MTYSGKSSWMVPEPPSDFATRAVDAMLATQARGLRRRPRFVFYLAVAALLATGTAMALAGARSRVRAQLAPIVSQPVANLGPTISLKSHTLVNGAVAVPELAPSTAPRRVRAGAAARAPSPEVVPSARPPLKRPACQCERGFSDFICDCY